MFLLSYALSDITRVFNQNDWMKKRVFILFLNRIWRRLEGGHRIYRQICP